MRIRVKICGITRPEDGLAAAELGADAIGLVFYPPSPRAVDRETARAIVEVLPPFVTVVGLFVDADDGEIRRTLDALPLDLLQFHGRESPEACERFERPFIKSVAMQSGVDLAERVERYHAARGLLLDAHDPGRHGGTGTAFDWSLIPPRLGKPIVLAGGLNPDNVAEAVRQVRPFAVDVSSGVEKRKGIKDANKMRIFIERVRRVESKP